MYTLSFVFICYISAQVSGSKNVLRMAQQHQDENELVVRSWEPRQIYAEPLVERSWSPRRIYSGLWKKSETNNNENNIFERDGLEIGTRKR
jgi:hypothetical protein